MFYDLQTLVKKTRRHVGEHPDRGNTAVTYVVDYLNDSLDAICAEILALRDDFFSGYYDVTLDGSREYNLPNGIDRIYAVEDITQGASDPMDTNPIYYEDRFRILNQVRGKISYYPLHGKIGIPAEISSGTLRVYYPQQPKPLFYDTCTAATGTSVTFDPSSETNREGKIVPVDDYYNGMFLVNDNGEFKEITDFVASTFVFTTGTWETTQSGSTSVLSLVAPFSPRFYSMIALGAGIAWRLDLDLPVADMQRQYSKWNQDLNEFMTKRQTHGDKQVRHIGR